MGGLLAKGLFIAGRTIRRADVLNSVPLLGLLAVVPAVKSADKIAGNSADALKLHAFAHRLTHRQPSGIPPC